MAIQRGSYVFSAITGCGTTFFHVRVMSFINLKGQPCPNSGTNVPRFAFAEAVSSRSVPAPPSLWCHRISRVSHSFSCTQKKKVFLHSPPPPPCKPPSRAAPRARRGACGIGSVRLRSRRIAGFVKRVFKSLPLSPFPEVAHEVLLPHKQVHQAGKGGRNWVKGKTRRYKRQPGSRCTYCPHLLPGKWESAALGYGTRAGTGTETFAWETALALPSLRLF